MDRIGIKFTSLCRRDANLDAAKQLLESIPKEDRVDVVNFKDRGGSTPLMAAIWDGANGMVAFLLESGANLNVQNLKGNTALHFAYECSQDELVKVLIDAGASQTRKNYKNKIPIDLKDKRKMDIQRAMDAETAQQQQTIVNSVQRTKSGRKKKVDNSNNKELIHPDFLRACKDGDLDVATNVLERVADELGISVKEYVNRVDSKGSTALMSAAWDGRLDVIALFVELGADVRSVNKKRNTAMHFALERGHYDIATYLKLNGGEELLKWRNRLGYTPIDLKHHFESKDHSRFNTPKMSAVERANRVKSDFQVDLLRACRRGDMRGVQSIIAKWEKEMRHAGMDTLALLDFPDKNLSTPLIIAVFHGQMDVIKYLIDHNVSISAANNIGNTSLHVAYAKGYTDIAKYLIEKGADKNLKNDKGETPEEAALRAMADRQAKLQKQLAKNRMKEELELAGKGPTQDEKRASISSDKSSITPTPPTGDKPDAVRPTVKPLQGSASTGSVGSSCSTPAQKLEFAQKLDQEIQKQKTTSWITMISSTKPPPTQEKIEQLQHVENIFSDDGILWEVYEDQTDDNDASTSVLYHDPANENWLWEVDVWKPFKTPADSYGTRIEYWQNLITSETSWKMPRAMLPTKITAINLNLNQESLKAPPMDSNSSFKFPQFDKRKSYLSQSAFQAIAMGMGLNDVIENMGTRSVISESEILKDDDEDEDGGDEQADGDKGNSDQSNGEEVK